MNLNLSIYVILFIGVISLRSEFECKRVVISRNDAKSRRNQKIENNRHSISTRTTINSISNDRLSLETKLLENHHDLDTASIVRLRGYQSEAHQVAPSPGYNLSLVRIVNPSIQDASNKETHNSSHKRPYVPIEPVLFIHGIFESGKSFLINSNFVEPKNYESINVRLLKENGLHHLLKDDPNANSLPFLLSNFGFDVWILSRRAALESQRLSDKRPDVSFNLLNAVQKAISKLVQSVYNQFNPLAQLSSQTSGSTQNYLDNLRAQLSAIDTKNDSNNNSRQMIDANPVDLDDQIRRIVYGNPASLMGQNNARSRENDAEEYWNFSLDEQANYDIPKVIDYILATTNRPRLSIIGHSLGAALPLMTLAKRPEYGPKINRQILFAPALHLGDSLASNALVQFLSALEPILVSYLGPISPTFFVPLIRTLVAGPCQLGLLQHEKICLSVLDALFGFSSKQLNKLSDNIDGANKLMDISGSGEIVQLMQSMKRGEMHHFDYRNERQNRLIYDGSIEPPVYDLSNISGKTRFSIWSGNKDPLVTQHDTQKLVDQLDKVQVEKNYVNWPGIQFNHVAFLLHKNLSSLVNIPTLATLLEL